VIQAEPDELEPGVGGRVDRDTGRTMPSPRRTNDLVIRREMTPIDGGRWVVLDHDVCLANRLPSYREAYLRASALARHRAASVWSDEDGRPLLVF
jgi:hypothetical protein